MQPTITGISERNTLGKNLIVTKQVVLTYTVGPYGPFTLITNQVDLNNGTATRQMQEFANTLSVLPGVASQG